MSDKDDKIMSRIADGREYRAMPVMSADNDNKKTVRGYATTFDTPYCLYKEPGYEFWEVIARSAFDKCDMSDVIMQYNHAGHVYARNSNKTLALTPDNHGLEVVAELGGTTIGGQLYEEIKGGYTTKMSFGFRVGKDERKIEEDAEAGTYKVTRTITEISKLYDVSAVSLPANDGTEISARNIGEGVIAEIKAERLRAAEAIAKRKAEIDLIKILAER